MLKGLGDIGNLMRLQKDMKGAQKRIMGATREGTSPNGMVKAVMNGEYRLMGISIDPDYLKGVLPRDLEAMIVAATNDAVDQIKEFYVSEMQKLTGGLDIPGLGAFLK
ncbi:MAG: YbaB/EbfC family nucleoid-associated protein [Chrysiogenales bacterium]|nr:MAG: YbaB/EbfC family nucleoid-associated protein [Chrysiogenales bacterium]